jgi:pimeloyl-ACP methyl ester carboxylesterase
VVHIETLGQQTVAGQTARVEQIRFRTGPFQIVGELRMPLGNEPQPAIIMVHGDGPATRDGAVDFEAMFELFLRQGYAVFSWDKPNSGASTGKFDGERLLTQRAEILVAAIEVLVDHEAIDRQRIGLWGLSQAGWVMPLALERSDHVAFMIVVSGGAEDSIEQMAYQVGQRVACSGGTAEQAALVEAAWPQIAKADTYDAYREAVELLLSFPVVKTSTGLSLAEENEWTPWPRDIDAFINPVEILERTTIPILALFGDGDIYVDPAQGAAAYERALAAAGNPDYQVVTLSGASHVMSPVTAGCGSGTGYVPAYLEVLESWLNHLSS